MGISEILQHTAKAKQKHAILLVREGLFWRAYEQSAFALCAYVNSFKVTTCYFKGLGQWLCYVGFPDTTLEKWTSEREMTRLSEQLIRLQLTEAEQKQMNDTFSDWKQQQVEMTKANTPLRSSFSSSGRSTSQTMHQMMSKEQQVVMRLQAFPLERSSPIDCMNFLSELKNLLQTQPDDVVTAPKQ